MMLFRLRRALHRLACRFGWHIGGNLAWNTEDGHYLSRCLWCEREMQWLGGEWREYIRPPRRPLHHQGGGSST